VDAKKKRQDQLLVERGLVTTRAKGQAMIMAGDILVDDQMVDRPGRLCAVDAIIQIKQRMPYVSRAGIKLAEALAAFEIDVKERVCADVGACTGGFTDVLLQNAASRVYAIDVGYGQLDWKMRQDERVVVMERTNARYLEALPEPVSFVCIDVSFISLKLILPAVGKWITPEGDIVALIKPQFEAGRSQVGKGGLIKDAAVHRQVLTDVLDWAAEQGYAVMGLKRSPIRGAKGNVEFLTWLRLAGRGIEGVTAAIARETSEEG
jgi:23S rRNA (cytidine1920-2'-O)/16S rRNA (cytidine1409-2'-O)-methyltransferase